MNSKVVHSIGVWKFLCANRTENMSSYNKKNQKEIFLYQTWQNIKKQYNTTVVQTHAFGLSLRYMTTVVSLKTGLIKVTLYQVVKDNIKWQKIMSRNLYICYKQVQKYNGDKCIYQSVQLNWRDFVCFWRLNGKISKTFHHAWQDGAVNSWMILQVFVLTF